MTYLLNKVRFTLNPRYVKPKFIFIMISVVGRPLLDTRLPHTPPVASVEVNFHYEVMRGSQPRVTSIAFIMRGKSSVGGKSRQEDAAAHLLVLSLS